MGTVRTFTLETRLQKNEIRYFSDMTVLWCQVYRVVWQHYIKTGEISNEYIAETRSRFGILTKTMNSVIRSVKWRYSALVAFRRQQCESILLKLQAVEDNIEYLKLKINMTKPYVVANNISANRLQSYRNWKKKLFAMQRKRQKLISRYDRVKKLHICFGTRELWCKQHRVGQYRYKTKQAWLKDFRKHRDSYMTFVGSSNEKLGNMYFQLSYDDSLDIFHARVRLENIFRAECKWLCFDLNFKSKSRCYLIDMLRKHQSMTYRVVRRDNAWYLQVVFRVEFQVLTSCKNGCLGVDYNDKFLAVSLTDGYGNLIEYERISFISNGIRPPRHVCLPPVIKYISSCCRILGVALVIEDLAFSKKRATSLQGVERRKNNLVHFLGDALFKRLCESRTAIDGVQLVFVSPAYTSVIARQKYCEKMKLNSHIGASFVIARRGQGYIDKLD